MRRILAGSAALMLAAVFLLPVPAVAGKTPTCGEEMAPGWTSMGYARVPVGLAEATHEFRIDFAFTDVDGSQVADYMDASFDVSSAVPVVTGTVWVTWWGLFAPDPHEGRYPIAAINPMQPAVFVMGWGNYQVDPDTGEVLTRQMMTEMIHGTVQTVSLDGGPAVAMHFHQTYGECYWLP